MANYEQIQASHVAGVSEPRKKPGMFHIEDMAMIGLSFLVSGMTPIGIAASHGIDRMMHENIANREKQSLAEWYRHQIAAQLGIDPAGVNKNDLELAAQHNPMLAASLERIEEQKNTDNNASIAGSLAAAAFPATWIPGASFVGMLIKPGVDIATRIGYSSLFMKDKLYAQDVMDHISEKQAQGQEVSAEDIFMLRIAQNDGLQEELRKANGKKFHKLNDAQQQAVLRSMPGYFEAAQRDAYAVNQKITRVQDLMTSSPISGSGWSKNSAQRKDLKKDFRQQIDAERQAMAMGGMQPGMA